MTMNYKEAAHILWAADQNHQQIPPLTEQYPDMTVEDAYAVQQENILRKVVEQGDRIIGYKIGLTSDGMQKMFGVFEPDYGHLLESMLLMERDSCSVGDMCQPRVEGELTFCLKKDLKGPGVTVADVYNATAWVTPSIEVVDSRFIDWKIKLPDTIADNASSGKFVVGGKMTPIEDVDMRLTGMTLEKNGKLVGSGTTAEVFGNPAAAVAWLANKMGKL